MSLEKIEYLDQKSAKERAKYRSALNIKDIAALIYFDGDGGSFKDHVMINIARKEYIFCWVSSEIEITQDDHQDGYNGIFVLFNQKTKEITYETKASGLIVKQKSKIKVDLTRIEINVHGQISFKDNIYEDELRQLIIEELLETTKDVPPPPTKDEIERRKKWTEANKFINSFIKEALINHKISYEPKKEIIEGQGMRFSRINYYLEFIADLINARRWGAECDSNKTSAYCKKHNIRHGDSNGFIYTASAQNIEIEKAILAKYVNSKVGAWLRDIIKATLLAEWLSPDEQAEFQSITPADIKEKLNSSDSTNLRPEDNIQTKKRYTALKRKIMKLYPTDQLQPEIVWNKLQKIAETLDKTIQEVSDWDNGDQAIIFWRSGSGKERSTKRGRFRNIISEINTERQNLQFRKKSPAIP